MRVTLIRPPVYSSGVMGPQLVPYLGVLYVAAAVREAGHEVDVIDMLAEDIDCITRVDGRFIQYGMPFEKLAGRLRPSDVIGFTCMFSQDWPFHRRLIEHVSRLSPASVIFAGGEHISALPEFSLENCSQLGHCIVGEGERAVVALLAAFSNGLPLSGVPSLVTRSLEGGYFRTEKSPRICDTARIARPAWDLIPLEQYLARGLNYHLSRGRTMPVVATRGCPYQCSFCSNAGMWGRQWVEREARDLADEIEEYVKRYRAGNFVFSDLTAIVSTKEITGFCHELLRRKLDITWQIPTTRTESLDRELLELMYRAGCRDLDVAIESGSRKVLASVNKRNDPARMARVVSAAVSVGMNVSSNIIIGLPQETWGDFWGSWRMLMRLALRGMHEVNVFPFMPYPGSQLFRVLLDKKRIVLNDDYFKALFCYADLSRSVSWSGTFSPRMLGFLRIFLMASFYSLMLLSHPLRLFRLFRNVIQGRTTTKLEGVLRRIFLNFKAARKTRDCYAS